MRILIIDSNPVGHGLESDALRQHGVAYWDSARGAPSREMTNTAAVVCIHSTDDASDDARWAFSLSDGVVAAGRPIVLFSSELPLAMSHGVAVRQRHPAHPVFVADVADLARNLAPALERHDWTVLVYSLTDSMLGLLTMLWHVGLEWEATGKLPVTRSDGDLMRLDRHGNESLLHDGELQTECLKLMCVVGRTSAEAVLYEVYRRCKVEGREVNLLPDINKLKVKSVLEYWQALSALRDDWLTQINSAEGIIA